MHKNRHTHGFSLLELSIILTIMGFLVGGVLLGRAMITNAKLQTVLTDADYYATAVNTFKQKYYALPGDYAGAVALWGAAHATPAICITTNSLGSTLTCDGTNDGKIGGTASTDEYEIFRFWQHLNNAQLIKANVSGISSSVVNNYQTSIGVNVPKGSMNGSGWSVLWVGTPTGTDFFAGNYGNILQFGAQSDTSITNKALLTAEQAFSLDTKMDDGMPALGKIRGYMNGSVINASCTTSTASTAGYNISLTTPVCAPIFVMGF